MNGRVVQISVSQGGVPKRPIPRARVDVGGVEGDAHNDTKHHGGPDAAVCLFSADVIDRLRAEGHPIAPGTTGENVTVAGLDWSAVAPGGRFMFDGGLELEVTRYTSPCSTIRDSFKALEFQRIKFELHPGESRVYARVLAPADLRVGEGVRYAAGDGRRAV